jgi:transposase-like protein
LDAIHYKVRHEGRIVNRAVYSMNGDFFWITPKIHRYVL